MSGDDVKRFGQALAASDATAAPWQRWPVDVDPSDYERPARGVAGGELVVSVTRAPRPGFGLAGDPTPWVVVVRLAGWPGSVSCQLQAREATGDAGWRRALAFVERATP